MKEVILLDLFKDLIRKRIKEKFNTIENFSKHMNIPRTTVNFILKNGVSLSNYGMVSKILKELDIVLEKRELIKITVLETSFMTARGACEAICEEIGAEPVQCIGNKFVIYRMARAKDNRKIELPK